MKTIRRLIAALFKTELALDVSGLVLLALSIDGAGFDFWRFMLWTVLLTVHAVVNWGAVVALKRGF